MHRRTLRGLAGGFRHLEREKAMEEIKQVIGDLRQRHCITISLISIIFFSRIPTMTTWGAVGSVAFIYVTDWKVIVGRIPYIKGKFKTE